MTETLSKPDVGLIVGHADSMLVKARVDTPSAGSAATQLISPEAAHSLMLHGERSPYYDKSIEKKRQNLGVSGPTEGGNAMAADLELLSPHALKVAESTTRILDAMQRHRRPGLLFSGGKDSLACLYLARPYWQWLVVLWANAGDPYPETVEQMERIRQLVPNFVEVKGPGYVRGHAPEQTYPADMVPLSATPQGRAIEASAPRFKVHSKFECCWSNWWLPLNNAVNELGIDLLIRGDRADEKLTNNVALRGSNNPNGGAYLFPLRDWSKEDVFAFLRTEGVEIPHQYAYGMGSLDCMHCTAWLNESGNKLRYLRDFHPDVAVEYERRLRLIQSEQERHVRLMEIALGDIDPIDGEGCGD